MFDEKEEAITVQNAIDEEAKKTEIAIAKETITEESLEELVNETLAEETVTNTQKTTVTTANTSTSGAQSIETEQQQYTEETTFEVKPSLWQKIKNSKLVKAATYLFRIKVRIELPNALPEGRGEK